VPAVSPRPEALIVFLRDPGSSPVKTRLAAEVGMRTAQKLYHAMLTDLACNLAGLGRNLRLYADALPLGAELKARFHYTGAPRRQQGEDLGARMANAFRSEFSRGSERVLLIGSDIPHLEAPLIAAYFRRLREVPVVLGPSPDGGYYLVGFQRRYFQPALFEDIPWGGAEVASRTRRRASELGLKLFCGPGRRDIDTGEDLRRVLEEKRFRQRLPALAAQAALIYSRKKENAYGRLQP
jgi:rSAM/selenodomain-associated transferase 1